MAKNFLITTENNMRNAEVWATTYHDAIYIFNALKYTSKVKRVTLHEVIHGRFCMRGAFTNPNFQGIKREAEREKELA